MAWKICKTTILLLHFYKNVFFLETSEKNPLELLYFNTQGGGRNDFLFVNLHRCLKNLRKFDKQHIKSSLVFVLVDGGCLAAIFL